MKKSFCDRLRSVRGDRSQKAFAELLGMSQQNWQRYEKGAVELDYEQLHRLCVICGVSMDWLFGLDREAGKAAPKVAERALYDGAAAAACAECARLRALVESQAETINGLYAELASKKKSAPSRARYCSGLEKGIPSR